MTAISPVDITSEAPGNEVWTVERSVRANSVAGRAVALGAAITTLASAAHPEVPVAAAITVVVLLPAVLVDVVVRRLPNRLVGGAAIIGLAATTLSLLAGTDLSLVDGLIGAAVMSVPLFIAHLISPQSMGFGDVKFALVLGAAVGLADPMTAVAALAVGSLAASVHGLCTRQRSIPFGPALLGGAIAVLALTALGSSNWT